MQTPELVTQIAQEIDSRRTAGGLLDLRVFQTELYRRQRAARTGGLERALARIRDNKYRCRVRQPKVADCRVIDTQTDAARTRLYFELSNRQVVRADRAEDRTVELVLPSSGVRKSFFRYLPGRRRHAFKNVLIRETVFREVQANAARKPLPELPVAPNVAPASVTAPA